MPVISPRRYSTTTGSSYLPPTTGTYRSTYSTTTSSTKDRGSTNYTTDISTSYGSRSNYFTLNRSTLGNSSSSTSGTTTSKYSGLTSKYLRTSADKELPPTGSTSRYTRGDSRTRDRDLTSSGNTPSSSLRLATTAADLYEKYSPSSYIPKCELTRSRSLSEAQKLTKEKTPTKDTSYNSSSGTGGTASSLSKVKLCALTSSPPPIPTHLNNNNNNNNIINNNIINYNNNKTTSSVSNHNSAYFGLNINNYNNKQQSNTLDACIATTNAATPFIIDSFSNKSAKLTTSDVGVYATAMNPINNNQFIHNNSLSSARTKNLYNMKGTSGSMTTTTTRTILNNFSNSSSSSDKQTTYKSSFSNNSNSSSSNKDMLKNEIDLVRSQLKSKSSEINNNSHKLLSSSTKSISNNLNNNNNNNNNINNVNNNSSSNSSSNHNGYHTNGISKITLPVKPLIHSKTSLLIKQNSLSNELMANGGIAAGGGGGASRNTISSVSELEAVTSKVLNSRTKFLPKTISSSNGDGSDLTGDDIKFIDTDDTNSNERLNRDALTSISTIRLLPTTPATKLFKTNDSSNENDKLFTTSSSPPPPPLPLPNTNINNSDDIKQQNFTSADSGIDSSNGSSNSSSSTWDSTTTITSVNTTATTTTPLMNGNGTATTTTPTMPTGLMTNSTRSVSNLTLQPATNLSTITNDDKISTTTKLIETDFDSTDSYRNASSRAALPPSSERSSKYWERDRPSITSRTLSDSDTFALSKSAFTSSSSLADSYDRGTSTETADGLCGLRNIGNTCFMNSVLQCLSHTNELTKFLRNQYSPKTSTKDQRILAEFVKLIKDMWSGSRSVTPLELKSAISSKYRMYSGSAQQDAQEFLRFFLDTLHCALNTGTKGEKLEIDDNLSDTKKADLTWEWYSRVENSLVKDLFVGQLKSSLKCTVCGNTSVTFDPFWDLSLPLPSSTTRCKLESCLDLFIKEEVLDGDEMPTCSKCKTRRKSTKTFTIQRFPKYLVIHLKRFSETRWSKLTTIVEFPTGERELEMSPYASPSNTSSSKYTLYGISNHMGSTAGGHYVAVCKHPILKKWHEFNDNVVSDSSDYNLVSSSAYLLFYERS